MNRPAAHPRSALVIIDVQNAIIDEPVHEPARLLANIGALLAEARASGTPVVFVQDDSVGGGPGNPAWEIPEAIAPREDEPRIRKKNCDSFHETALQAWLQERRISHLVIVGCATPFCIDTSCRRAVTLGYHVTLVGDAHSVCDFPHLPASRQIEHHNAILHGFGADIGDAEFLIAVTPTSEVRFGHEA